MQKINADLKAKKRRLQELRHEKAEKGIESQEMEATVREYVDALRDIRKRVASEHTSIVSVASESTTNESKSPTCRPILAELSQLELNLARITALHPDYNDSASAGNDDMPQDIDKVFGCNWKNHKEQLQKCANREEALKHKLDREAVELTESSDELQEEIQQHRQAASDLQRRIDDGQRELKQYVSTTEAKIEMLEKELKGVSLDIQSNRSAIQERSDKLENARQIAQEDVHRKQAELGAIIAEGKASFIKCAKSLVELKETTTEGFASAVRECELLSKNLPSGDAAAERSTINGEKAL